MMPSLALNNVGRKVVESVEGCRRGKDGGTIERSAPVSMRKRWFEMLSVTRICRLRKSLFPADIRKRGCRFRIAGLVSDALDCGLPGGAFGLGAIVEYAWRSAVFGLFAELCVVETNLFGLVGRLGATAC